MASAFSAFDRVSAAERGWPAKAQSFNPTLRLTAGLLSYSERAGRQHPTAHETLPNGRLCLSPAMPLLAHRYRYMYTLSQSDLSQLVCAIDTFQHCAPAADGRRQPLVVLKILNAQHWAIGAQEYERVRLLWREQSRHGTRAQFVRALSHCEVDAHFCIVWEMLAPLWSVMPRPLRPHAHSRAPARSEQPVRPPPAAPGAPVGSGRARRAREERARPRGRRSEAVPAARCMPNRTDRRRRRPLALQAAAAGCRGAAAAPAAVAPVQRRRGARVPSPSSGLRRRGIPWRRGAEVAAHASGAAPAARA